MKKQYKLELEKHYNVLMELKTDTREQYFQK